MSGEDTSQGGKDFQRAIELAKIIGFNNFNDSLHTAIAENNNCFKLLTFNKKDFSLIQNYTSLEIEILG